MNPAVLREDLDNMQSRENHGAWILSTTTPSGAPLWDASCAISHVQFDERTGKRLLVIELRLAEGRLAGKLLLPEGLSQKQGVVLQFEESASDSRRELFAEFKGRLVDLDFDEASVAKLRSSSCLYVIAEAETGEEVNFSIPLIGFASALTRAYSIEEDPRSSETTPLREVW